MEKTEQMKLPEVDINGVKEILRNMNDNVIKTMNERSNGNVVIMAHNHGMGATEIANQLQTETEEEKKKIIVLSYDEVSEESLDNLTGKAGVIIIDDADQVKEMPWGKLRILNELNTNLVFTISPESTADFFNSIGKEFKFNPLTYKLSPDIEDLKNHLFVLSVEGQGFDIKSKDGFSRFDALAGLRAALLSELKPEDIYRYNFRTIETLANNIVNGMPVSFTDLRNTVFRARKYAKFVHELRSKDVEKIDFQKDIMDKIDKFMEDEHDTSDVRRQLITLLGVIPQVREYKNPQLFKFMKKAMDELAETAYFSDRRFYRKAVIVEAKNLDWTAKESGIDLEKELYADIDNEAKEKLEEMDR